MSEMVDKKKITRKNWDEEDEEFEVGEYIMTSSLLELINLASI